MKNIFIISFALIFSACSTTGGVNKDEFPVEIVTTSGGSSEVKYKDFLPHIEIKASGIEYYTDNEFYDKYTRVFIVPEEDLAVSQSEDGYKEPRSYDSESRSWLKRWLLGRTVSQAFVATFSLNNGETKFSSELFSLSFDSNNVEGEAWATSQSLNSIVSPYFKVGAGDTLGMKTTLNLSENNKSEVSANVVSALSTAAAAIAPQSSLVTTLSSERISKASSFLDDNVSALFDRSISESLKTDIQLEKYCQHEGFIAEITLIVPDVKNIKKSDNTSKVGTWRVYLESPIDSIFTKTFINNLSCENGTQISSPDFTRLQSGDILEFKIADDLTIYDFVFSRLELTDIIKVVNEKSKSAGSVEAKEAARSICARVERRLPELGLNTFDTAATLWAVANSDQFSETSRKLLLDENTCTTAKRWKAIDKKPNTLPRGI